MFAGFMNSGSGSDPVSAEYADFGEFYIGIQLPLDELFRRLQL